MKNCAKRKCPQSGDGGCGHLHVTLVHHDLGVRALVAKATASRGWGFGAHGDLDAGLAALQVLAAGNGDPPPTAPALLLLLPLRLPSACGLEWTRRLSALCSQARAIVLADPADAGLGFPAIYAGARGFLLLPLVHAELLAAVEAAARGSRFMSPAALAPSLDALYCPESAPTCTGLTSWQVKVLWAISEGHGEKGAARLLGLATRTVHTHTTRIYPKLGVHSLDEALEKVFGERACAFACPHQANGRAKTLRART
jgi:DNA-binding NarL/FixJ family response regulator